MKQSHFEQRIYYKVLDKLPGNAPGCQIQVHQGGRKLCDISAGDTYPYYDLASLTKIIFTVPTLMLAFERGKWNFDSKVIDFWPGFQDPNTKIVDLLTHTSGAVWWSPIYQEMNLSLSISEKRKQLKEIISKLPWEKKETAVYSDVGMWILGFCLEEMFQKPLTEVWMQTKEILYPGLSTLNFHLENKPLEDQKHYAPTQRCPWRGKLIQGEVHDENAWSFGGLSTHAGLFSSIDDVSWYGLFLRSQLMGLSKTSFKLKTAKAFTSRALPLGQGDWALGFMMPTVGTASCGDYFSPHSIGHTGFTGTSIWYDPYQDLLIVILSNRVLLGRDLKDFAKLRPQIHNWIVEELKRM